VKREFQARFCEQLGVQFPGLTRPAANRISPAERTAIDLMDENPAVRVYRLSDARDEYLKTHQKQHQIWSVTNLINFAVNTIGDRPLQDIRRADGKTLRDAWLATGIKTKTVARNIVIMSSIFNVAKLEFELSLTNPFSSIDIEDLGDDSKDITPFTDEELATLVRTIMSPVIRRASNDLAYSQIAGLQLETGLRQAEALYLRTDDIFLEGPVPYVSVRAIKELNRSIKNKNSERKVPLVGISLIAAQRALAANTGTGWLFNHREGPLTNNRSPQQNALKWLHLTCPDKGSHSFRYSVETRLTLAGVEQGIIDAITGHASQTKSCIAAGYFGGWPLDRLQAALNKIALPVPEVL
jgi:integrase